MLKIGLLGVAHMHAMGYANAVQHISEAQLIGVYDENPNHSKPFEEAYEVPRMASPKDLVLASDAVIIASENVKHLPLATLAAQNHKPILCEKPLVTNRADGEALLKILRETGTPLMTAFPCRYAPAYKRLKERISLGEIGSVQAVCATNRGSCPMGWFVDTALSGGGAMIDHVVHVADLLRDLFACNIATVQAQIGNQMYQQVWDDTAMLTFELENGVFATLDSSWSRHQSFKTWGDVTLTVVGDKGVLEVDLFQQALDIYRSGTKTHALTGYGSDLDLSLVQDFVECVLSNKPMPITAEDGFQAAIAAIAGYESAASKTVVASR